MARTFDQLEVFDVVRLATLEEIHQSRDFLFVNGDDEFADLFVGNLVLVAVLIHEIESLDTE
jgi:hypothetical protein